MTSTRSAKKKSKVVENAEIGQVENNVQGEVENTSGDTTGESHDASKDNCQEIGVENPPEKNALPTSGLLTPSGSKSTQKNPSKTDPRHNKAQNKFSASMALFQNDDFYTLNSKGVDKKHKKKVIHVDSLWDKEESEDEKVVAFSPSRKRKKSGKRRLVVVDEECSDIEFDFRLGGYYYFNFKLLYISFPYSVWFWLPGLFSHMSYIIPACYYLFHL